VEDRTRGRERPDDQDFGGDYGKGTCPVCGQRVELKRSMKGLFIAHHLEGGKHCPATGEPAPEAEQ
jgi:hypothetical protein